MIEFFYNITSFESGDGRFSARIELVRDNIIYNAHFPGHPITPGACQLEIVRAVASRAAGRDLEIVTIKNLKFIKAVDPLENNAFSVDGDLNAGDDGLIKCTSSVTDGDAVFAKISMYLKG